MCGEICYADNIQNEDIKDVIRITRRLEHADAFRSKNKRVCAEDVQNRFN